MLLWAESSVFIMWGEYGMIPDPPCPLPGTLTFGGVDPGYWVMAGSRAYGWTDSRPAAVRTRFCITCCGSTHGPQEASSSCALKNGVQYQPSDPVGLFVDLDAWYAGWVEAVYNEGILPECGTDPLTFCSGDMLDRSWVA